MPAVDYRQPGGLTAGELRETLRAAIATGHAVGIEVTIYNPPLDSDGEAARGLVSSLSRALGT
jgi:arginase